MKRGKPAWTARISEPLRRRVEDMLAAGTPATETFRRLDLQRHVRRSTFSHWAATWKRQRAETSDRPGQTAAARTAEISAPAGESPGLLGTCLEAIGEAVAAGRVKVYELTQAVRALVALEQLRLAQADEARKAELHEHRMKDFRAAVEQATDAGRKTLSREDVYELVDQVMRGEAA